VKTQGRHAQEVGMRWERGGREEREAKDKNIYVVAIGSQLDGRFLAQLETQQFHMQQQQTTHYISM
jgi:hypothetical protein